MIIKNDKPHQTSHDFMNISQHHQPNKVLPGVKKEAVIPEIDELEGMSLQQIQNIIKIQSAYQADLEKENENLRRTIEKVEDFQDRYNVLYNFAPGGYVTIDKHGIILESNQTFALFMGLSEDIIISKIFADFIFKKDQDIYQLFQKRLFESGEESVCDLRINPADSISFWVCLKGKLFRDKNCGKYVGRIIVNDINKYKQTEEALKRSEEKFRSLVGQSFDMLFLHDLKGNLSYVNKEPTADPLEINTSTFAIGEREYFLTLVRDITARKTNQKAIIEDKENFEILLDSLPASVLTHDLKGRILFCNKAACINTGYSKEELLNLSVKDIDPGSIDRDDRTRFWQELNMGESTTLESNHIRKNGSQYPAEIHISAVKLQGEPVFLSIAFDITERKRAETATEEAHQRLLTILDSIHAKVHVLDMKSHDILFVNQYVRDRFGDIVGKKCWSALHSGQKGPCAFCPNQNLVDDRGNPKEVYRREFQDKKLGRWYDCQDRAIKWIDGRIVKLEIGIDITDRKQAEEYLRESEFKYRKIAENISDVVWITDLNLNIIYVSTSIEKLFGESVEAHMNRSLEEKFPPKSLYKINSILAEELEKEKNPQRNKNKSRMIELEHYRADGSTIWVSINTSFLRDDDGNPVGIQGVTRDISEHKKMEEQLMENKRFLEAIFDSIQDGICVLDTELNIIDFNKTVEQRHSQQMPLKGKKCYEAFHNRSLPCEICPTSRSLKTGKLEVSEVQMPESGSIGTLELYAFPMFDATGKPSGVVEYGRNITERKHAKAALEDAHQRLVTVLNSIDAIIYVADMETYEVLFANRYTKYIHGNIAGAKCWQIFQKDKTGPCEFCTNNKLLDAAGRPGALYKWEFRNTKNGKWYECRDSAIKWVDGRIVRMEIAIDITDRKQAEMVINDSLREKITLLKEIHHRVKNNMQVISSLLNLQLIRNKDENVKRALMDCQGRINSMASVHEMLYMSDSLSVIDCQIYISKLANDLLQSYQIGLNRFKLRIDAKGVILGIQQASPLGLIINELLSNAIKYAFLPKTLGQIMIILKYYNQDMMKFVFCDNGVGIPKDLDWRNTKSLGLNLIVHLAEKQLGGTIRLDREKGTCFTIKFNRDNNQPEL
jgi:PAS domain S-box-containing protein